MPTVEKPKRKQKTRVTWSTALYSQIAKSAAVHHVIHKRSIPVAWHKAQIELNVPRAQRRRVFSIMSVRTHMRHFFEHEVARLKRAEKNAAPPAKAVLKVLPPAWESMPEPPTLNAQPTPQAEASSPFGKQEGKQKGAAPSLDAVVEQMAAVMAAHFAAKVLSKMQENLAAQFNGHNILETRNFSADPPKH